MVMSRCGLSQARFQPIDSFNLWTRLRMRNNLPIVKQNNLSLRKMFDSKIAFNKRWPENGPESVLTGRGTRSAESRRRANWNDPWWWSPEGDARLRNLKQEQRNGWFVSEIIKNKHKTLSIVNTENVSAITRHSRSAQNTSIEFYLNSERGVNSAPLSTSPAHLPL